MPIEKRMAAVAAPAGHGFPREKTGPVPRIRRSGSPEPLFLHTLARQGKLLMVDPPGAPVHAAAPWTTAVKAVRRRWKRSAGMAACLSAAAGMTLFARQVLQNQPPAAKPQPHVQDARLTVPGVPAPLRGEAMAGPARNAVKRG